VLTKQKFQEACRMTTVINGSYDVTPTACSQNDKLCYAYES